MDSLDPPTKNKDPVLDLRQKSLIELGLIAAGFLLVPFLQALINLSQAQATPSLPAASPVALPQLAWQASLLLFLILKGPAPLALPAASWAWRLRPVATGLGLAVLLLLAGTGLGALFPPGAAAAPPFPRPAHALAAIAPLCLIALAVVFEELFYRVYLLERLAALGAGRLPAGLIALALFMSGHAYQGSLGMLISLCLGGLLVLSWWRWRSFPLQILAHGVYNLTLVLAAWFLRA